MGRMNEGFQSDQLKQQIRSYKKRQQKGLVETYETSTGEKIEEGNLGLSKMQKELKMLREEQQNREKGPAMGWHIVQEEKNALGLLKRKTKTE